jgi:hypothetical protein
VARRQVATKAMLAASVSPRQPQLKTSPIRTYGVNPLPSSTSRMSLVASPGGRGVPPPLRYVLALHRLEQLEATNEKKRHFERRPGEGNSRIPFARESSAWEMSSAKYTSSGDDRDIVDDLDKPGYTLQRRIQVTDEAHRPERLWPAGRPRWRQAGRRVVRAASRGNKIVRTTRCSRAGLRIPQRRNTALSPLLSAVQRGFTRIERA